MISHYHDNFINNMENNFVFLVYSDNFLIASKSKCCKRIKKDTAGALSLVKLKIVLQFLGEIKTQAFCLNLHSSPK